MRKYTCLFICMATFLALLAGCKVNDSRISVVNTESTEIEKTLSQSTDVTDWNPSTYETVNNFDGVTMTVKKGTATSTGLTVVIENDSSSQCTYGVFIELEKKINEIWYGSCLYWYCRFNCIGYDLSPGDCREWAVDWNWLYGSLESGKYRIIKDILDFRGTGDYDTYYLAAEFTIN